MTPDDPSPYSATKLRQSTFAFLATKGATAPLNLLVFLVISTRLPRAEFALYAWLMAFGKMSEWLSYLGINWVALHYVPDYRSRIGGRSYVQFVWSLVAVRCGLIALLVAVYVAIAPNLLAVFGQPDWLPPLRLFLLVMAADLAVTFLRISIFESLLEHGVAQRNILVQHLVALPLLFMLSVHGSLSIDAVMYARMAAAWISLAAALVSLARMLRQPAAAATRAQPQPLRTMVGLGVDNYVQDLVRILSDGPMVTLLASRLVGVASLALFGFAANLADSLSRVLPTTLFLGLLRPRLIADYGRDRTFERLRGNVGLLLKLSMACLASAAAVLVAVGRPVLDLLSDGKYAQSYELLLLFVVWLGIGAVRMMQGVLTNVLGYSRFLRGAAFSSLLVVPAALALVSAGAGPTGLVLGMILGEATSVALVARQLRRHGYHFAFDARGYLRIATASGAGAVAGRLALLVLPATMWSGGAAGVVTLGIFAFAIRALRPFDAPERAAIESVAGRRLVFL